MVKNSQNGLISANFGPKQDFYEKFSFWLTLRVAGSLKNVPKLAVFYTSPKGKENRHLFSVARDLTPSCDIPKFL